MWANVQKNYIPLAWKQLNTYTALAPGNLQVRGTKKGARLYWQMQEKGVQGFFIYRDAKKVNRELLPGKLSSFEDTARGLHRYEVHPLYWGNDAEAPSASVLCLAGSADSTAPRIVVSSPPASVLAGQTGQAPRQPR